MKKVRIVHFWIGVIVSVFLLIESTTGIILYFNKGGEEKGRLRNKRKMRKRKEKVSMAI
ncbi:PepSY domain-containing protein [Bacillus sp. AFS088145]|uniref:PepSY domain-containing protein n=1 Tax=Bacillus sp. AFS088145 TaxID=2033514 RepID=UPI00115549AD|nr:PepSY domain-containing protein [Bacillus sp. AFS088145]